MLGWNLRSFYVRREAMQRDHESDRSFFRTGFVQITAFFTAFLLKKRNKDMVRKTQRLNEFLFFAHTQTINRKLDCTCLFDCPYQREYVYYYQRSWLLSAKKLLFQMRLFWQKVSMGCWFPSCLRAIAAKEFRKLFLESSHRQINNL